MHYIQKHILDELRTTEVARYTELNQDEVESGHFHYHLMQLVKDGYITQQARGQYRLTASGQQFVDKLSQHRIHASPMPKVITYTLLKDGDRVILQEKLKQPYLHLLNMIGGKLHEGETSEQAAVREVLEKTNIIVQSPKLAGIFEVLIYKKGAVHTHVVAYVYVVAVQPAAYAEAALQIIPIAELAAMTNLAPDFLAIFNKIENSSIVQTAIITVDYEE